MNQVGGDNELCGLPHDLETAVKAVGLAEVLGMRARATYGATPRLRPKPRGSTCRSKSAKDPGILVAGIFGNEWSILWSRVVLLGDLVTDLYELIDTHVGKNNDTRRRIRSTGAHGEPDMGTCDFCGGTHLEIESQSSGHNRPICTAGWGILATMPAIVTWVTIAGAQSPHLYRGVGNPRDIARDSDGCHNRRGTITIGHQGFKYLIFRISSFRANLGN
ncbi:hypothetical protein L6452_04129 [Arctium lappa]|uniref:Uncharacterized protein n=1 Tax=Arctium lappa TaxID=4217 RepID=A0ACB9FPS5_ARCLA|nr:hypothetical protein L6452_04129 [Arctium lappa]